MCEGLFSTGVVDNERVRMKREFTWHSDTVPGFGKVCHYLSRLCLSLLCTLFTSILLSHNVSTSLFPRQSLVRAMLLLRQTSSDNVKLKHFKLQFTYFTFSFIGQTPTNLNVFSPSLCSVCYDILGHRAHYKM